jgi:multidrug efflux pump subunit AcrA (membrane-fusion protein)
MAVAGEAGSSPTPERRTGLTILAEGLVVPAQPSLPLAFSIGGRLLTVEVQPGDTVSKDDLVATLDQTSLMETIASAEAAQAIIEAQIAQAKAPADPATIASAENQVTLAEAALAAAQANRSALFVPLDRAAIVEAEAAVAEARLVWDGARRTHEQLILNEILGSLEEQARLQAEAAFRALEAAEARLVQRQAGPTTASLQASDAEIAQAEANLENAETQLTLLSEDPAVEDLAILEAQLAQAQLNLDLANQALADSELLAPWPGTVLSVDTAPGALVGSGTPIVTLLDVGQLEFQTTNLSERDLSQIQPGQEVLITLKAFPDDPFEAVVIRLGSLAEGTVGDAAAFPVFIDLSGTDLDIRPGMTGRVEFSG